MAGTMSDDTIASLVEMLAEERSVNRKLVKRNKALIDALGAAEIQLTPPLSLSSPDNALKTIQEGLRS
jgi:uncharacterized coiled-coil protein SlyX